MLLALDTATTAVTVAVHDGERVLASTSVPDERRHTETLAPAIRSTLAQAGIAASDLSRIVVGTGPGPFTGLRVGVVTARTMGLALGIEVDGLCSLDAIAAQVAASGHQGELLVATDARRKEVYWARYRVAQTLERLTDPDVTKPADLPAEVSQIPCTGRGPELYPDTFTAVVAPAVLDVDAGWLATEAQRRLAAGEALEAPDPQYLRRPDAQPRAPRTPAGP
ncbi:tRNA (adenosine(37)-N6)-threonylcarbamoyltransferase complex dimerization subunit type 1 TsaB [Dermacoccaceae bacterium W4C1]